MNQDKQRQEISLIGRVFSMEALLLLMGIVSLVHGIANGVGVNIFFGLIIIPGVFFLAKVRKKDWKKHWADLEAEQLANMERSKRANPADKTPDK